MFTYLGTYKCPWFRVIAKNPPVNMFVYRVRSLIEMVVTVLRSAQQRLVDLFDIVFIASCFFDSKKLGLINWWNVTDTVDGKHKSTQEGFRP